MSSTVIVAGDFNSNMADPKRELWDGEAMCAVVKALDGRKVAITVDRTGCTEVGVTLVEVDYHTHRPAVLVAYEGQAQRIWFPLRGCGMVLPLGEGAAGVKAEAVALFYSGRARKPF
ncbi:hypothetical protein ACIRPQ_29430 [Streptomyces sp. NPDC101213]|uniref:hypothetical protein n=1 Tax=Streptomyces sp. NPDC101213 TaxID=3366130 RepID=UPI0038010F96